MASASNLAMTLAAPLAAPDDLPDHPAAGPTATPSKTLFVSRLRLTDFRNYSALSLNLDRRPVVLTGPNGSGKTNLIEAVSLLAPGRGLRSVPFVDLAHAGGGGTWAVAGRVEVGDDVHDIGTGLSAPDSREKRAGRIVKIDGIAERSATILGELMTVVWLTPAIDGVFMGAGGDRRRFFDRLIAGIDPGYRKSLSHFERAMRQRNKLLDMGGAAAHFDALEAAMAEPAIAVAAARVHAIEELQAAIFAKWRDRDAASAFPWATLAIDGSIERDLHLMPATDAEDAYRERLARGREIDRAARRTLDGPHRTDFIAGHGPKQMPAKLSSTGEQKALLTGMILAHAELVTMRRGGRPPLILLDEIAAHLDEHRRVALFEDILRLGVQAFMTGTDPDVFAPFGGGAQFLHVDDGKVLPRDQ